MLKQLSYLWIVVLIFSLAACDGDKQEKKPIVKRVKTVIVGLADVESLRRFPGKILPAEQSQLSFEVSGRVYQLPVNEGDKVKKGQLLAALEPEKIQDTFDKTEAKLKLAKAQYKPSCADNMSQFKYISTTH